MGLLRMHGLSLGGFALLLGLSACQDTNAPAQLASSDASVTAYDGGARPTDAAVEGRVDGDAGSSKPREDAGAGDAGRIVADGGVVVPRMGKLPIASGDSVFYVGNSFFSTYDRNLSEWVSAIGREMSPPITIESDSFIEPGNTKLAEFLTREKVQQALGSKKHQVFVIQAEEREPVDGKPAFMQAVRNFHKAITAANAQMVLFMTWDLSAEKGSDFFRKLSAAYEEIGQELDVPVIPVGLIYDDCNKDPYPGQAVGSYWLTGGELHQTETGSAVNAYATFGMLTGVDPMGSPIDATANTNSADMLRYLSDKSWARVAPRIAAYE